MNQVKLMSQYLVVCLKEIPKMLASYNDATVKCKWIPLDSFISQKASSIYCKMKSQMYGSKKKQEIEENNTVLNIHHDSLAK